MTSFKTKEIRNKDNTKSYIHVFVHVPSSIMIEVYIHLIAHVKKLQAKSIDRSISDIDSIKSR